MMSFKRGQAILEMDRLAAVMNQEKGKLALLLKKLSRKKLISYQAVRSGKGPETLIVTVDTYDRFIQNLKKVDDDMDNALASDGDKGLDERRGTSENVLENSSDNENIMEQTSIGIQPAAVCSTAPTSEETDGGEEKETLIEEMLDWTYDEKNHFMERTDPETLSKQLGHMIDKIGIGRVRTIFYDVSDGLPWGDFDNENKCALTELWNRLKFEQRRIERPAPKIVKIPEKKYIQMEDPIREAIFLLEQLNSIFGEKLGIETVAVCLLLDKNYIGWTGYSLGQFKVEHAEVLGISMSTMRRIITRLIHLGLLEKDRATNRIRFHPIWYGLRKSFIEKINQNIGGANGKKIC